MSPKTPPKPLKRCTWTGIADAEYTRYHDEEWGVPKTDDRDLLEKLILEGFQSGLSWLTILRKRDNFRRAFHNFDAQRVARYGDKDRARLVMPSLAWGYHGRQAEWFGFLDRLERDGARVANPTPVLRWNSTKTYLVELAAKGAPVVPTHACDRLTDEALQAQGRDIRLPGDKRRIGERSLPDLPETKVTPAKVSAIKTSDDGISFDVDRVGSPVTSLSVAVPPGM